MEFIVRSPLNQPDVAEVRYDCACGCKPRARYTRNTQDAGHEHCCWGTCILWARRRRKNCKRTWQTAGGKGEDSGMAYTYYAKGVKTPWGESVSVAYALPDTPKPH